MKLMTWNVHGMRGRDGRHDPERVAEVIAAAGVDVAGLLEVGALGGPGELVDPAGTLARLTGLAAAYGLTELRGGFPYGNCILSRHSIGSTRGYDLSVAGREPRGCLRADVEAPEGAIHFFNVHLGLHWRERRRQAAQLLSADILRDTALAYPLVLVGDINTPWSFLAVPRWIRRHLGDAADACGGSRPTWPASRPLLRLDRAYVGPAVRVVSCDVLDGSLVREASDHLPVVFEIVIQRTARRPPPARPIHAEGVTTAR
jgi:endonuclease/exonuclease/phosphatase family metal-dependent hydrolase